jgi:hypothetical protein
MTENEEGVPYLYKDRHVNIQKFRYDLNNHHLSNPYSDHQLTLVDRGLWAEDGDTATSSNLMMEV